MIRFLLPVIALITVSFSTIAFAADEATSIEDLLSGVDTGNPSPLPNADGTTSEVTVGITKENTNKKLDIGRTGFPIPRFVSLKRDVVNVRKGPNETFGIAWTFTRKNLPVEIIAEYDNWRKIRDHFGDEGWIFHSLLTGARYALVSPWKKNSYFTIHRDKDASSKIVAKIESGSLGRIRSCDGTWCLFNIETYQGYMKQEFLTWGIYTGDLLK
ncbi:MAG: SH3 domain-containing protein [Hyphomicrobiales bacterium]